MPPVAALLLVRADPAAIALALAGLALYVVGVHRARRRGRRWSRGRTAAFALAGVGAYLAVTCGFPGAAAPFARWPSVVEVALLVAVVPGLVVLGRPVALARAAGVRRVDQVLRTRAVRVLGSPAVAPLVPLAVFVVLLTPSAGWLRTTGAGEALTAVVVPLAGLAVAVPLAEPVVAPTSLAITAAFLIAFVELLADAIPGILMRLAVTVLDGVLHRAAGAPGWVPDPLRDQQLAGDLLWCIAEAADVPALVLLFVRWTRTDRREAGGFDELSDEEYDARVRAHLSGR